MNFSQFEFISFDCYGTLIDWETGILSALRPVFIAHSKDVGDAEILRVYAELEREAEAAPYLLYRVILKDIVRDMGKRFGFSPTDAESAALAKSLRNWNPFPDSVDALQNLKRDFRIGVLSNVDDDLFAASASLLAVEFDVVITAQQVGAYKPSLHNFNKMRERVERMGIAKSAWLHVAQTRAHDIAPAKSLGVANVWVNRPVRYGASAVTEAAVEPDVTVADLAQLTDQIQRSA